MFTFLRVPWAKTVKDVVCVAQNRLTSIKDALDKQVSTKEAYDALVAGFQNALRTKLDEGTLIPYEKEAAQKLRKHKFSTNDWNLKGTAKAEY
jgi:lipoate-protein ligase A